MYGAGLTPTGSGVGRFEGCAAADCTSFYAVIPSRFTRTTQIFSIRSFWPSVLSSHPSNFWGWRGDTRARAQAHTHARRGSSNGSKDYNVTSLSLHSLIIRGGDGWFSGFLRISAECSRMRMDLFRAVCLPSALSLRRHSRLAHFERACSSKISIQYHLQSPFA